MRRSKTQVITQALRVLAVEIQSFDGVANAAIREAADRLEELQAHAQRKCAWTRDVDDGDTYDGDCGIRWSFVDGGPSENRARFCPACGGVINIVRIKKHATPTDG